MKPIYLMALGCALLVAACASQPDARVCGTGIICPEGTKCAAAQAICITNDCGDAIVQTTEKCDDGNIEDGDGCAANCLSRETCGDTVLNAAAGELCDDGNTTGGDGCSADCHSVEQCGNGVRDVNEVCDDGNTVPGDGCSGNCKSAEICGNGIVDLNEKCDDAGASGGCNPDCQGGTGCGDGAIDIGPNMIPIEECDDGNAENADDCSDDCHLNHCGDGLVQTSGSKPEECDPGAAGELGLPNPCNRDCTIGSCGDGKVNEALGEECDNALANGDDKDCTLGCKVNVCGDGKYNQFGPNHIEDCDDGDTDQLNGCSNECTTPDCGNGVIEGTNEACDDFNEDDGDGCSHDCQFESCGDGIVNNGEACDPGPAYDTQTCNSDCTPVTAGNHCGDSKINVAWGEQCDDGNNLDGDACRMTTCKLNVCGDGNKSATEGCDDGNSNNLDSCTNSCAAQGCGDGIINPGVEQCDDGPNNSNTARCLTTCILNVCGDNHVLTGVEECDPGAANIGPNKNCTPECKDNVCGDGFRDTESSGGTEACDDHNPNNETACPYGVANCTLCNSDCSATEPNLKGPLCGDGTTQSGPGEMCDDGNTVTETTCPYNTRSDSSNSCSLCNNACLTPLSFTTGAYCGDGATDGSNGETCDDDNNNACGTCGGGCTNPTGAAVAATGVIVTPGSGPYGDNDNIVINDGYGHTVTFEFDANGNGVPTTSAAITTSPNSLTATQMRDNIISAINNPVVNGTPVTLNITASAGPSDVVKLVNQKKSKLGNVAITNNVGTTSFFLSGMSGGNAGDCDVGIGCKSGDDCKSNSCTGSPKTCQ